MKELTGAEKKWAKTTSVLELIEELASRNGALEAQVRCLRA